MHFCKDRTNSSFNSELEMFPDLRSIIKGGALNVAGKFM